jgi:uncharacterized membrane protein
MNSRARIAGHPIHPMLVAFPIAFYTATIAVLLAYIGTGDAFWYRVAMVANLAGVVTAVIAVLPGAIDLFSLPPRSPARVTGLQHAGFNLLATVLFAVSAVLLYRGWTHRVVVNGEYTFDATIPLAIGVVGWILMVIAGSLGWSLVQTHHVGVRPAPPRADLGDVKDVRVAATFDAHDPRDTRDERDRLRTPPTGTAPPPLHH